MVFVRPLTLGYGDPSDKGAFRTAQWLDQGGSLSFEGSSNPIHQGGVPLLDPPFFSVYPTLTLPLCSASFSGLVHGRDFSSPILAGAVTEEA